MRRALWIMILSVLLTVGVLGALVMLSLVCGGVAADDPPFVCERT